MIQKIKNYYSVFGLKQTVLKIFRYANDQMHIDNDGIYNISRKEQNHLYLKNNQVYIFTDSLFVSNPLNSISEMALRFNELGYSVNYIYFNEKVSIEKNLPLCLYKSYNDVNLNLLDFENKIIIIDSDKEQVKDVLQKSKNSNCYVICNDKKVKKEITTEVSKIIKININNNILETCTKIINQVKNTKKCSSKFYKNISIVILNYNNKNVIFNCLDTLLKYKKRYEYEIIVVDNQSSDGSYLQIKENYKNIKLYQNTKNGCSSGRNIGIEKATKDYVIFLDSDQWILHENWLDNYLQIFNNEKNVGAIGWTGGWFNNKGHAYHTVNNFLYKYMPPKVLYRNDIGYLGTGGMMVEKKLLKKIKGFDINYDPTCYEDTDISLKIRNTGKEIYYCPYLGVGHLPHQTTKSGSKEHETLIQEKGNYFVKKWKKINPKLLKYKK